MPSHWTENNVREGGYRDPRQLYFLPFHAFFHRFSSIFCATRAHMERSFGFQQVEGIKRTPNIYIYIYIMVSPFRIFLSVSSFHPSSSLYLKSFLSPIVILSVVLALPSSVWFFFLWCRGNSVVLVCAFRCLDAKRKRILDVAVLAPVERMRRKKD